MGKSWRKLDRKAFLKLFIFGIILQQIVSQSPPIWPVSYQASVYVTNINVGNPNTTLTYTFSINSSPLLNKIYAVQLDGSRNPIRTEYWMNSEKIKYVVTGSTCTNQTFTNSFLYLGTNITDSVINEKDFPCKDPIFGDMNCTKWVGNLDDGSVFIYSEYSANRHPQSFGIQFNITSAIEIDFYYSILSPVPTSSFQPPKSCFD